MTAEGTEEPIATWESALLHDWEWQALRVVERDAEVVVALGDDPTDPETERTTIYHGRVRSPMTHDRWEYGTFSASDLKTALAFRTDKDTGAWP